MRTYSVYTPARKAFGIVLSLLVAFGAGAYVGSSGLAPSAGANTNTDAVSALAPEDVDFGPLYKSWRVLEENFNVASTTDAVSAEEHVFGAVSGLADSYGDPYTVFFPPQEKEIFESQVRGDFEGVGMEIGIRDSVLTVIAPLKDTPAYRAGVESGDSIIAIDGESTAGLSTEEAVQRIRGEKGTAVVLTVIRDNKPPFDISVVRDTIVFPTVETELRPDGVFVLHLYSFNSLAPQLFRKALKEFVKTKSDKLIIDLRGNPGGFLEAAVDIASWFLPAGTVVVTEDYGDDAKNQAHRSRGYNVFTDRLKLVILIDQGSASASEILAGALREHGKAALIGETSFGKGSVQQIFDITDDTSLKITIAHWLTPNGNSISSGGIIPDIEIEMTTDDTKAGRDPQLERATQYLLNGE